MESIYEQKYGHMRSTIYPTLYSRILKGRLQSVRCSGEGCNEVMEFGNHVYWERVGRHNIYFCPKCARKFDEIRCKEVGIYEPVEMNPKDIPF